MGRVAFLSYYFPPIGGAGAQRPARFVRYLRDSGWDPVVVTGPGPAEDRWTPRDDALQADLPADLEVRRVAGPEPGQSEGWATRRERWLGQSSPWARWWIDGAVASGAALDDVDLVYAWMSPFESAVAAARLGGLLRAPWVADLGDPWALDEMMVYPTRWHRRRELRRMRRDLSSAAAVVMSTPEAVARVRRWIPELRQTEVVAIPNGYDGADFEPPVEPRSDGVFRIVHTGYLHTELGLRQRHRPGLKRLLGTTLDGVDFLTRSHVFLLRAVEKVAQDTDVPIEVHLAGVVSAVDREQAEAYPFVRMPGYLDHDRTLELLRTADLLFLPMHDLPRGTRAGIVPGKTYEYLGSGRPILAAVPDGDARDLLERFREGLETDPPRPGLVARYEYRALAATLTEVFERAADHASPPV
jgi:hypothetical protein